MIIYFFIFICSDRFINSLYHHNVDYIFVSLFLYIFALVITISELQYISIKSSTIYDGLLFSLHINYGIQFNLYFLIFIIIIYLIYYYFNFFRFAAQLLFSYCYFNNYWNYGKFLLFVVTTMHVYSYIVVKLADLCEI